MSDQIDNPNQRWWLLAVFIATGCIAVFVSLNMTSATLREGEYHPVGNDAFYHARRIIDTAGERGFYQFDETIHMPEGSAITWPWAYDYLMGQALGVWQSANPNAHPMHFLAPIPTLWVLLNVALFLGICRQLGLSIGVTAVAGLGYALFPFTQLLHGIGNIDHHYVEHSFVLGAVLLGMRWMNAPESRRLAIGLGVLLGAAPAFHNGLFMLQVPLAMGLGMAWLKGAKLDASAVTGFAVALPLTTLLMALPSPSLRAMAFDFTVLSWFHVYISTVVGFMSWWLSRGDFDRQRLTSTAVLALACLAPIIAVSATGVAFISGDILLFDRIEETQSPMEAFTDSERRMRLMKLYGWLVFLVPIAGLAFGWRWLRESQPAEILFAAFALVGLALLATQIRLNYFGSFALILFVPLVLHWTLPEHPRRGLYASFGALLFIALAYREPLRVQLFANHNLGLDPNYELTQDLFDSLEQACNESPGTVLVENNLGHPVRYRSNCSVIANNFLLTEQHEQKIELMESLWFTSPADLIEAEPQIDYVLVVLNDIYLFSDEGLREPTLQELASSNPALALTLTLNDEPPPNYQLLAERRLDDGRDFAFARLFRILR